MFPGVAETIADLWPDIVALRRELHSHPEIRFTERWTSARLARFLDEAGISYRSGFAGGTGIIATITGGAGPTVALRADMDALEIEEQTGAPYASRVTGTMHACGHDGHMAILCGAGKALAQHRERIRGTVRLIFQPAEEIAGGGKRMVDEGAVDGAAAVFGLHGWPGLGLGQFGVKAGPMMASASDFKIVVAGRGCHAADPASGVDPIRVGAQLTSALHTIVSREIDPWAAGVITVSKFHGGRATNIVPESAVLEGTFRSLELAVHERLRAAIARVAAHTAEAFGASARVEFSAMTYPPLVNDPAMTELARAVIGSEMGKDAVHEIAQPCMAAEDFAFYLQRIPGSFVWLGLNPDPARPYPALHNPGFNFNDDAIPLGMRLLTGVVFEYLNGSGK